MAADKRQMAATFRARLGVLIGRSGNNISRFAAECGLDRSALSQFLDPSHTRLPRAETLFAIASAQSVSADWLLGISQSEQTLGEVASISSVESGRAGTAESPLAAWHREAEGYKIRYAPSSLPDLLRTKAVTEHEFGAGPAAPPGVQAQDDIVEVKSGQAQSQLDYTRLPETDMEVVLPFQRLMNLADGSDIWSGLARGVRQAQLEHMARLLEELYPTFRLFLYDGLHHYCAPFTVFGPKRAAVYLGEMYLVINSTDYIRQLAKRFDNLIRVAAVGPDKAAEFVRQLRVV